MQKLLLTLLLVFIAFNNVTGQNNDSVKEKTTVISIDHSNKTTNPLYIIQMKDKEFVQRFKDEASREEVIGFLQPEWIESVDVLRSQEGVEKYGSRAEEGVILIALKNDTWDKLTQNLQDRFK